jgi:hypothetical protein
MRQVKWLGVNGGRERHAEYMERRVGNTFKHDMNWFNYQIATAMANNRKETADEILSIQHSTQR